VDRGSPLVRPTAVSTRRFMPIVEPRARRARPAASLLTHRTNRPGRIPAPYVPWGWVKDMRSPDRRWAARPAETTRPRGGGRGSFRRNASFLIHLVPGGALNHS